MYFSMLSVHVLLCLWKTVGKPYHGSYMHYLANNYVAIAGSCERYIQSGRSPDHEGSLHAKLLVPCENSVIHHGYIMSWVCSSRWCHSVF